MKICQKCNLSYDDDNAFCSKCGLPLTTKTETMFCPYCGKKLESDMEFCPYCGKNLRVGTSYTNIPSSNVNKQDSYHAPNNTYFNTNLLSSFDLNTFLSFIKNTPFIKWTIIVFMYVVVLITYIMTEGLLRSNTGSGAYLTLGSFVLSLLVFVLIFGASWFIVNKLHSKAAKILKYIILYGIVIRVVFKLFGLTYGVMISLIYFLVVAYYTKRVKESES